MKGKALIKIGDIFEVPLSHKRRAFGQYVFSDKKTGPIVQIFDSILDKGQSPSLDNITRSKLLFPPVYMGIGGVIKLGRWKIVGHSEVSNFNFKGFLTVRWDMKTKRATKWYFYNGEKSIELGPNLPEKFRDFEWRAVSAYDLIEKRIETSFSPFEFIKTHGRWPTKEEIPWDINE